MKSQPSADIARRVCAIHRIHTVFLSRQSNFMFCYHAPQLLKNKKEQGGEKGENEYNSSRGNCV